MPDEISSNINTIHSSFREKLIEHLFIGELLKLSWADKGKQRCALEISKPEVDNSGYDLIAEMHNCVRHIQLKATRKGGKASYQKVHIKLADKPSGCVVWIFFDEDAKEDAKIISNIRFFGADAGKKLAKLKDPKYKPAKHTKFNKDRIKSERPNIRIIPKSKFDEIESIKALYHKLFSTTK